MVTFTIVGVEATALAVEMLAVELAVELAGELAVELAAELLAQLPNFPGRQFSKVSLPSHRHSPYRSLICCTHSTPPLHATTVSAIGRSNKYIDVRTFTATAHARHYVQT